LLNQAAPGVDGAEVIGGEVKAYAKGEGIKVEFARRKDGDYGTQDYAADGKVADDTLVACLLLEGEALFGRYWGLLGWSSHCES
jgi:hypothetical protein